MDLEVTQPLNYMCTKMVDYRTYMLGNRDSEYNYEVAQKITKQPKRVDFQMGDTTFTGDDPIAIINFLKRFKIACERSGFSEGAAMFFSRFN